MASVNRDAVLSRIELAEQRIEVEGYDGEWILRELTGVEQARLLKGLQANGQFENDVFSKRLVAACIVDDGGNRIFDEKDVARFPRKLLSRLQAVAEDVNKFFELEEVEKNSEATRADSSTSS